MTNIMQIKLTPIIHTQSLLYPITNEITSRLEAVLYDNRKNRVLFLLLREIVVHLFWCNVCPNLVKISVNNRGQYEIIYPFA